MTSRYRITIPGKLHRSLVLLEAFGEDADPNAADAFRQAVPRPYGRGEQYQVIGDSKALRAVLDVLRALVDEADNRTAPAYELGVELDSLRRCSTQSLRRVV